MTAEAARAKAPTAGAPAPARQARARAPPSRAIEERAADVIPASVRETLSAPGETLPPPLALEMGARLGHDFSRVRVHADAAAGRSARQLGALAYAAGAHVVFAPGRYAPASPEGRALLAHELAHVAQSHGLAGSSPTALGPRGDAWERDAEDAARAVARGSAWTRRGGSAAARVRLTPDPRLEARLDQIRALGGRSVQPDMVPDVLRRLDGIVEGMDLADPDNARPLTRVAFEAFGPEVALPFLERVDQRVRRERGPTAAERAQAERTARLMQVPSRHPYGLHGPGILLPIAAQAARPMAESLGHAFEAAGALVGGIYDGVRRRVGPAQAEEFGTRMLESSLVTAVFPPIFLAGTVVGVGEDVVMAARGLVDLIANFSEVADAVAEIVRVAFSDAGAQVARALGLEIGQEFGGRLLAMLRAGTVEFTYELGRLVGPSILYTVLGLLGVPELLFTALAARILPVIRRFVALFPRLARLLRRFGGRLGRAVAGEADDAAAAGGRGGRVAEDLRVPGGMRRFGTRDFLDWEARGGHALRRHGPFHTQETLRQRLQGEPGFMQPTVAPPGSTPPADFRIWGGSTSKAAGRWASEDAMADAVSEVVHRNLPEIEARIAAGQRWPPSGTPPIDLGRPVGSGWVTTAGPPPARAIWWREGLSRAVVVIAPDPQGGWYLLTAYPS